MTNCGESFSAIRVVARVSVAPMRKEAPGMYEAYVDLDAGAWTKMRIEIAGTKARFM